MGWPYDAVFQLLHRVPFWAVQSLVDWSLQLPGSGLFSESIGRSVGLAMTLVKLPIGVDWMGPCPAPPPPNHRVRAGSET